MLHPISETGKSKKIFLRISKGAIISKRNGEMTSFEAISGSLKGIELREHEFENEVADNTAQMNWIQTLVDRINAKLTEPVSVTEASDDDDLPEEFYN